MRLSDLQNKDVVDVSTGVKLGSIIDIEISGDGKIEKVYIYGKKGFLNIAKEEESISWSQITKIGSDVILITKNLK